jgi:atypical dual specificity phosphatase
MPMPFIHPNRRLNFGGPLNTYNDELPELYSAGVRAVVSLLNIPSDALVYETAGFNFLCLPIPDGDAPTVDQAQHFIRFVDEVRILKQAIAVHCEAGLGRTGTMLAAYLIAQGETAENAIALVRNKEPVAVETTKQIGFLKQFAALKSPHRL